MQIDWFTLVAEVINFLILVALLKYFLYDRIINLVDEREAKITNRYEEAEQQKQEAQREAEMHRQQRQELEAQREEKMAEAKEEAEAQRKSLFEQARREIDETQSEWRHELQRERESFFQELRRSTAHQTYALARQALRDLAGVGLEKRVVQCFVERLEHLDEEQRAEIAASIRESNEAVVISTAFDLPAEERQTLSAALQEHFGDGLDSQFKTSDALISGIELKADGHKLAWSLDDYLDTLEERLAQLLNEELDHHSSNHNEQNKKGVTPNEQ